MIQEEINKQSMKAAQKGIQLVFQGGKLTMEALIKALKNYVEEQRYTGKQSIKNLIRSGKNLEQIDIANNVELKAFAKYAQKCGMDYSVLKDSTSNPPTWNLFFKGKDKEIIEKFIKDFTTAWERGDLKEKTSIREKLHKFREQVKRQKQTKDKMKNHKHDRGDR